MMRHLLDQGTGRIRQLLEHRWLRLLLVLLLVVALMLSLGWLVLTTAPQPSTPSPGATASQLRVLQVALAPKFCTQVAQSWSCGDVLSTTGSSAVPWKASSSMPGASVAPERGTLAPGERLQVTLTLPCVHAGTIDFTGPTNQVAVTWACYADG